MSRTPDTYPIPNVRNLAILAISLPTALGLLWAASRSLQAGHWGWLLASALAFSFVNNTNFSLLHEAVHGILNSNRRLNHALGWLLAASFPTSFNLQQLFHLGHHARNRTDAEMFDLYYPSDRVWLKRLVIYAMPTGFYWLSAVLVNGVFLVFPLLLRSRHLRQSSLMKYSSFDAMLNGIPNSQRFASMIRLQIVATLAIHAGLAWTLQLEPLAWLCCYWCFGMNWGSLQYTDHAFSPRDIRHGAWNLRVNPIVRWIFLNYHHHLAHHEHPQVPWVYLPRLVDPTQPRPSYLGNFLKLLSGPYPATEPSPKPDDSFLRELYQHTPRQSATRTE